jgi:hypothetical protein
VLIHRLRDRTEHGDAAERPSLGFTARAHSRTSVSDRSIIVW